MCGGGGGGGVVASSFLLRDMAFGGSMWGCCVVASSWCRFVWRSCFDVSCGVMVVVVPWFALALPWVVVVDEWVVGMMVVVVVEGGSESGGVCGHWCGCEGGCGGCCAHCCLLSHRLRCASLGWVLMVVVVVVRCWLMVDWAVQRACTWLRKALSIYWV